MALTNGALLKYQIQNQAFCHKLHICPKNTHPSLLSKHHRSFAATCHLFMMHPRMAGQGLQTQTMENMVAKLLWVKKESLL